MSAANACIYVLAGTNGAGKTSVLGQFVRRTSADFVDPDALTRELMASDPSLSLSDANSRAWSISRDALEKALRNRSTYAFETTLGGRTITRLLERALDPGMEVRMLYVGLASPELNIARVRARVAGGGHDIDESKTRERYTRSRENLLRLLPRLTELALYDNIEQVSEGQLPSPILLVVTIEGEAVFIPDLSSVPDWAKPIVELALQNPAR